MGEIGMNASELNALKQKAREVLETNDLGSSTRPAPNLYPHQWNWDSAFIAVGLSHFDEVRAQTEIRSLLKGQWCNGMVPHIIFNPKAEDYHPGPQFWECSVSGEAPEGMQTSGITQPPILAYAAYQVYRNSWHKGRAAVFLRDVFPALKRYHRFLCQHRDPLTEGLVHIIHPWESGMDNSPCWDEPMNRIHMERTPDFQRVDTRLVDKSQRPTDEEYTRYTYLVDCYRRAGYDTKTIWKKRAFAVQSVFFNSVMVASLGALEKIARILGEETLEIECWIRRSREGIEEKLWDAAGQAYRDYDLANKAPVCTDTVSRMIPLFARIPDRERASHLIRSLLSPEYTPESGYPVCSTATTAGTFDPKRYWRGPVWININWLIIQGLMAYGYFRQSRELAQKTISLIGKSGFREYFNPLTGEGYGADNFSWTAALFIDLVETVRQDLVKQPVNNYE
jgi:hypothetical protein